MNTTLKTILITAGVIVLAGISSYAYLTRPARAPSVPSIDVNESPNNINPVGNPPDGSANSNTFNLKLTNESTAQFKLNEVLSGTPTQVVGITHNVSGDVSVTLNPAKITVDEIKINARTLKTNNEQRNGAIANFILKSDQAENEFIVFKNVTFTGFPNTIVKNTPFNFTATGDLLITGKTKKVSFNGQGTVNNDNSFSGSASTTVTYGDWGVTVPNFPFLANVDKQVKLTLNFVAK